MKNHVGQAGHKNIQKYHNHPVLDRNGLGTGCPSRGRKGNFDLREEACGKWFPKGVALKLGRRVCGSAARSSGVVDYTVVKADGLKPGCWRLHVHDTRSKPGEDGDGVVALHQPQHLRHVPNRPVRLPAGDPLQHGFKGAIAVSHRVGVGDPRGGESTVGCQVFSVLCPLGFGVE